MEKEYYSVKDTAKLLNFSRRTIYRRIKEGAIPATRLGERGHYRIHRLDLPTFQREVK